MSIPETLSGSFRNFSEGKGPFGPLKWGVALLSARRLLSERRVTHNPAAGSVLWMIEGRNILGAAFHRDAAHAAVTLDVHLRPPLNVWEKIQRRRIRVRQAVRFYDRLLEIGDKPPEPTRKAVRERRPKHLVPATPVLEMLEPLKVPHPTITGCISRWPFRSFSDYKRRKKPVLYAKIFVRFRQS